MTQPTKTLLAVAMTTAGLSLALTTSAHPQDQDQAQDKPAIENTPADPNEPTLDDLLDLGGDDKPQKPDAKPDDKPGDKPVEPDADKPGDTDPELNRDLERRLSGEEAATQFAQAIQEMGEVAIRLDEEKDPGLDTQRMQDQIILKLEQIIASAAKTQSPNQQQQGGQPKQGQPRQADKGGQPNPGQQPGQKPGEKPGDKNGQQQGNKPGDKNGQQPGDKNGQKPGDKQGQQPGDQNGQPQSSNPSNGNASQGSVRNEELSMKDLREGEWGNLPPRLRDELAESLSETFNPVYRAATEAFYRRIAEMSQQAAEEGQ